MRRQLGQGIFELMGLELERPGLRWRQSTGAGDPPVMGSTGMDDAPADVGKRITDGGPVAVQADKAILHEVGSHIDGPAQQRGQANELRVVVGVEVAEAPPSELR